MIACRSLRNDVDSILRYDKNIVNLQFTGVGGGGAGSADAPPKVFGFVENPGKIP